RTGRRSRSPLASNAAAIGSRPCIQWSPQVTTGEVPAPRFCCRQRRSCASRRRSKAAAKTSLSPLGQRRDSMRRRKRRSSTRASCPCASARACYARRPPAWRRSPRSALCGETSREELGELGVAVVARDVERAAAGPGARVEVHAARSDEELHRQLV